MLLDSAERIAAHFQSAYYDNFAIVASLADFSVLRPGKF